MECETLLFSCLYLFDFPFVKNKNKFCILLRFFFFLDLKRNMYVDVYFPTA